MFSNAGIPMLPDRAFFNRLADAAKAETLPRFRTGLDAKMALRRTHFGIADRGAREVIDADLSDYFNTIPHGDLMRCVARRIADGTVSNNAAKQVMDALWSGDGQGVDAIIAAKGLKQMNDSGALDAIIDEVMAANAPMVEQFRAGKDKAFNALVGLVMKASKGKANPQQAGDTLRQKLG